MTIFNQAAHEHFLAHGYTYERVDAEFDDGDAENGPGTWGSPAYDVYTDEHEHVGIADGGVADRTIRDLERENWEEMNLPDHGDWAIPRV